WRLSTLKICCARESRRRRILSWWTFSQKSFRGALIERDGAALCGGTGRCGGGEEERGRGEARIFGIPWGVLRVERAAERSRKPGRQRPRKDERSRENRCGDGNERCGTEFRADGCGEPADAFVPRHREGV